MISEEPIQDQILYDILNPFPRVDEIVMDINLGQREGFIIISDEKYDKMLQYLVDAERWEDAIHFRDNKKAMTRY